MIAVLVWSLASAACAQVEVPNRIAPLLDARADEIVRRVDVPSPSQKVGEVRLIRRGDAEVVQTLLQTKILSRVVGKIREKETANWPPGRAGEADARRYVEALAQVRKQIWERVPKSDRRRDRRLRMMIEFVLGDTVQVVVVGGFEADESGASLQVAKREPLALLELSRDYVRQNMRLIAADSFHADGAALDDLLGPLVRVRAARAASEAGDAPMPAPTH